MTVTVHGHGGRWESAVEIAAAVRGGEVAARDVVEDALARIAVADGRVRAFTETWPDLAREAAADVDARVARGERLPLAGVPIGVKASEGLGAPQTLRLRAAGCVPVGATSVPGRSTSWQTYGLTDRGPTRNPLLPDRSPAGRRRGRRPPSPRAWCPWPPARTGLDRCGSRARGAASSASSRPTA